MSVDIKILLIILFIVAAPLQTIGIIQAAAHTIPTSLLLIFITSIIGLYWLITSLNKINKFCLLSVFLIFSTLVFSSLASIISSFTFNALYTDLLFRETLATFLLAIMLTITIWALQGIHSHRLLSRALWLYWFVCMGFLIGGLWQYISFKFGIYFPNFGQRTNVHGLSNELREILTSRVTSFTNEPSYLAPFLVECFILSRLFFTDIKVKVITLMVYFVAIVSFSMSAIFELLVLQLFIWFTILRERPRYLLMVILFMFFFLIILIQTPFHNLLVNRFIIGIDPEESGRIYILHNAVQSLFKADYLTVLFGFGPGMFVYAPNVFNTLGLVQTDIGTSNNIYVDVLFQYGIYGIFVLFSLLFILWRTCVKGIKGKYSLVVKLLFIHLLIYPMYRGDFMTAHFYSVILLIIYTRKINDLIGISRNYQTSLLR